MVLEDTSQKRADCRFRFLEPGFRGRKFHHCPCAYRRICVLEHTPQDWQRLGIEPHPVKEFRRSFRRSAYPPVYPVPYLLYRTSWWPSVFEAVASLHEPLPAPPFPNDHLVTANLHAQNATGRPPQTGSPDILAYASQQKDGCNAAASMADKPRPAIMTCLLPGARPHVPVPVPSTWPKAATSSGTLRRIFIAQAGAMSRLKR